MILSFIDSLSVLVQKPIFWATATAVCATVVNLLLFLVNLLLFLVNRKTFKLLYEKPHIHVKAISIAPRHKSPDGMIPDGTRIDMEIINPSSFQNVILNIKLSFFPFITPVIQNEANIKIDPFSRKRLPQTIESNPFDKYKNKLIKIVLVDIKNRKITKYCLLKNH